MVELISWIFVMSVIIIDASQTDQNSNQENKWTERLNPRILNLLEPNFIAMELILLQMLFQFAYLDGHFKNTTIVAFYIFWNWKYGRFVDFDFLFYCF